MNIRKSIGYLVLFLCFTAAAVLILHTESTEVDSILENNTIHAPEQHEPNQWYKEKININTADKALLKTLANIGDKTADAILLYRKENGGFSSVEEILSIPGIGQKTFDEIKDYICV